MELLSLEASSGSAGQDSPKPLTVTMGNASLQVKQSQFLTPRIGWVLLASTKDSKNPLLITTDGGQTWVDGMTAEVKEAILKEKNHLQAIEDGIGALRNQG